MWSGLKQLHKWLDQHLHEASCCSSRFHGYSAKPKTGPRCPQCSRHCSASDFGLRSHLLSHASTRPDNLYGLFTPPTIDSFISSRPSFDEFCLVCVAGVNTIGPIGDATKLSCLVELAVWTMWTRQDSLSVLQLCLHRQLDKTRQFCLIRVGGVNKSLVDLLLSFSRGSLLSQTRLSVVCNIRAPYSAGWSFRQYFFTAMYLGIGNPLIFVQNLTEIVEGENHCWRR